MKLRLILIAGAAVLAAAVFAQESLVLNPHGHQNVYLSQNGTLKRVVPDYSEVVTSTNYITAAETGATFYLNSTTEFNSYLPAPVFGLRYTFIVKGEPSGANYKIIPSGTGSANDIMFCTELCAEDAAGDRATAQDTVNLVDGQAKFGDTVVAYSDGTYWYVTATCALDAGITFQDAD